MGTELAISTPLYPNTVTPAMVEPIKVKEQWKKLENWQTMLKTFFNAVKAGCEKGEDIVIDSSSPFAGSLAHLQGLADSHANQRLNSLIQNFRGAALHLTVIKETARSDANDLAAIPDSASAFFERLQLTTHSNGLPLKIFQPHTSKKIGLYLKGHSSGELSLPLHLSLLISPLFLIMPVTHTKGKFPRQSIYQVSSQFLSRQCVSFNVFWQLSCALGNQKPEILTRVENEIWNALWMISEDSSMPVIVSAFLKVMKSEAFTAAVNMPATDPAFSFFRRKFVHYIFNIKAN